MKQILAPTDDWRISSRDVALTTVPDDGLYICGLEKRIKRRYGAG